jgi:hypothetical protein
MRICSAGVFSDCGPCVGNPFANGLIGRNVHRAAVVSRRDNNDMWVMAESLEAIAERISKSYH